MKTQTIHLCSFFSARQCPGSWN